MSEKNEPSIILDYGLPIGMLEHAIEIGMKLKPRVVTIVVYKEYDVAVKIERTPHNVLIGKFELSIHVVDGENWSKII